MSHLFVQLCSIDSYGCVVFCSELERCVPIQSKYFHPTIFIQKNPNHLPVLSHNIVEKTCHSYFILTKRASVIGFILFFIILIVRIHDAVSFFVAVYACVCFLFVKMLLVASTNGFCCCRHRLKNHHRRHQFYCYMHRTTPQLIV